MGLSEILAAMEGKAAEQIAQGEVAADNESRRIIEAAATEAAQIKDTHRAKAMERVRREQAQLSGAARTDRQRELATVREQWLDRVLTRARQRLGAVRATPHYARLYELLCREALSEFSSPVKFEIDQRDQTLMKQVKAQLGVDGEIISSLNSAGGLCVSNADGSITLENTFEKRLENGWKQLRPKLALLLSEEGSCPATTVTPTPASAP